MTLKNFVTTLKVLAIGGFFIKHLQLVLEEISIAHINLIEKKVQRLKVGDSFRVDGERCRMQSFQKLSGIM